MSDDLIQVLMDFQDILAKEPKSEKAKLHPLLLKENVDYELFCVINRQLDMIRNKKKCCHQSKK